MILEGIPVVPLARGLGIALVAVAFWAGGFVVAHYLWERWRN